RRPWLIAATLGLASAAFVAASATRVEEPPKVERERHGHQGPVEVIVEEALALGELSTEQRAAISGIGERAAANHDADREALEEELRGSASAIVRSGTTDSDEFDDALARAMDAFEQRTKVSRDAVVEIHGLLDAEQRAAVADGL